MDMTQIDEQWLELPRVRNRKDNIVAISNTGRYRRADGTISCLELRQLIRYFGKKEYCYRAIAENFLITVRRHDQSHVDHITHNPKEYYVNDVRNLRWCTIAENNNFEEGRRNKSGENNSMYGCIRDKSPTWKGDSAKPNAKYKRALKEYRSNPTEENLATLKEARLRWNEYRRHLRDKKSRQ